MSTVDQAVEAGARAVDGFSGYALVTLRAAWPVLSAPLRELHKPHECTDWRKCSIIFGGMCVKTGHCAHCGYAMPCPTVRELDRIDRELDIETDNQSGDRS